MEFVSEVTTLLEEAADRLASHGWTRKTLGEAAGPNCMAGAIQYAFLARHPDTNPFTVFSQPVAQAALQATEKLIGPSVVAINIFGSPCTGQVIADWNDRVCPDATAAADMLRHAAKYYAEEHSE